MGKHIQIASDVTFGMHLGLSAPEAPVDGTLWYDGEYLSRWNGTGWDSVNEDSRLVGAGEMVGTAAVTSVVSTYCPAKVLPDNGALSAVAWAGSLPRHWETFNIEVLIGNPDGGTGNLRLALKHGHFNDSLATVVTEADVSTSIPNDSNVTSILLKGDLARGLPSHADRRMYVERQGDDALDTFNQGAYVLALNFYRET